MIRFSCIYCGRKIRAQDGSAGQRAPCPACGHDLRVPTAQKVAKKTAPAEAASPVSNNAKDWEGKSNKEIARLLLRKRPRAKQATARPQGDIRRAVSPLLPRYDDLTLFALSVMFLLLLAIDPKARTDLGRADIFLRDGRVVVLVGLAILGMLFSLFGIFFRSPKPIAVKWPMLVFAVLVTAGTGASAGYVTLKSARGWLMVFPAWNVLNAALLLLSFRAGLMGVDCIIDRAARFSQVVVTVIAICVLLAVCQCLFQLHWAITYSVCVGYTMSLHHALADVFGTGANETD